MCGECPFESDNLHNIIVTCGETKHNLNFRATIHNWVSDTFPVVRILDSIQVLYKNSSTRIPIRTEGFSGADRLPEELHLVPVNISSSYFTASSGSGEGEDDTVTTEELVSISTEAEANMNEVNTDVNQVSTHIDQVSTDINEVSSSVNVKEVSTVEMKNVYTTENRKTLFGNRDFGTSNSVPNRFIFSLLFVMVFLTNMLI